MIAQPSNKSMVGLSAAVIALTAVVSGVVLWRAPLDAQIVGVVLGGWLGALAGVTQFWFGSSLGARVKSPDVATDAVDTAENASLATGLQGASDKLSDAADAAGGAS